MVVGLIVGEIAPAANRGQPPCQPGKQPGLSTLTPVTNIASMGTVCDDVEYMTLDLRRKHRNYWNYRLLRCVCRALVPATALVGLCLATWSPAPSVAGPLKKAKPKPAKRAPSMELDFKLRRSGGREIPEELEHLKIEADGQAVWDMEIGGIGGRCNGVVSPATHSEVVKSGRALIEQGGCFEDFPMRPEGETRLMVREGDWHQTCEISVETAAYPAFAAAVEKAAKEDCAIP